jgi:hypothetical protein
MPLCARENDADAGALARRAVDLDVTLRLLHETIDHAESEACALAALFGGEERLNTRSRTESGMPTPVSATETSTQSPAAPEVAVSPNVRFSTVMVRVPRPAWRRGH